MADFKMDDYVDVAERIAAFGVKHPEGSLQPADPAQPYRVETIGDKTFVVYTAAAYRDRDDPRPGIGIAWEPFPGKTPYTKDSELMNAETSAWGRAIVAVLASAAKKIASAQEVRNRSVEGNGQESLPVSAGTWRARIAHAGKTAGKTPEQIAREFEEWSSGVTITAASPSLLAEYHALVGA